MGPWSSLVRTWRRRTWCTPCSILILALFKSMEHKATRSVGFKTTRYRCIYRGSVNEVCSYPERWIVDGERFPREALVSFTTLTFFQQSFFRLNWSILYQLPIIWTTWIVISNILFLDVCVLGACFRVNPTYTYGHTSVERENVDEFTPISL